MDYQPLSTDDEAQAKDNGQQLRPGHTRSDRLAWAAIVVSCICLILNLMTLRWSSSSDPYTFPSSSSFPSSRGLTRKDIDTLRRPSQFIGFDKIHRNATLQQSEVKSFVNFPMLMAQVDASRPNMKVTEPRKGVRTKIGTVYPEISDMVSTFVQFRALDYGMERCELSMTIPATTLPTDYALMLSAELVRVYAVPQKTPLYADTLSYSNRPRHGELVGEPLLTQNSTWKYTFACFMDEIYTFEVACPRPSQTDSCSLRWTQDKEHAILMTQFSTV
ncbi:hypothetical protein D9613_002456 [Agrocybe pediades]|uniref:Ubiquitin 3 binding protein But2 C-terminal domain-containing protein n=1 Tax=Agrocybe pediades TaxID=84607 RepID=A0A8H4VLQ2_9AGAR|nr:hypothetical protein D9613_002456 [Agrocybe pediades]